MTEEEIYAAYDKKDVKKHYVAKLKVKVSK